MPDVRRLAVIWWSLRTGALASRGIGLLASWAAHGGTLALAGIGVERLLSLTVRADAASAATDQATSAFGSIVRRHAALRRWIVGFARITDWHALGEATGGDLTLLLGVAAGLIDRTFAQRLPCLARLALAIDARGVVGALVSARATIG